MKINRILEDIRRNSEEEVEALQEFDQWLQQTTEEWSESAEIRKEAFKESVNNLVSGVDEETSVEELLVVKSNLQEAYREPLLSAINKDIERILLEIGLETLEGKIGQIQKTAVDNYGEELGELHEDFSNLREEIENVPPVVSQIFAGRIQERPFLLAEPKKEALEILTDVQHNHAALSAITGMLSGYSWVPTEQFPLQNKPKFYPDGLVDQRQIYSLIEEIETIEENCKITRMSVARAIRNTITEHIESGSLLKKSFQETKKEWNTLSNQIECLEKAIQITTTTDSSDFGLERLSSAIKEIQTRDYKNYDDVKDDLLAFRGSYSQWKTDLIDTYEQYHHILENYEDQLEVKAPAELSLESTFRGVVNDEPKTALMHLRETESWISEKEQEFSEILSEEAVEKFRLLLKGETVPLQKCENNVLDELRGVIPVQLIINE